MAHSDDSSSNLIPTLLLLLAATLGFILSNSPLAESYTSFLGTQLLFGLGGAALIDKTLLLLVNDGLMAIFFLFVGLELKRELLVGELSDFKKASLPIFAAIGGMIVPAFLYYAFNTSGATKAGWGIPMATDIAFALGVLTTLGSRAPTTLKVMLTAIAIVDDLGAILVIAFFYTSQIKMFYLGGAFLMFLLCLGLNRLGVMRLSVYMAVGILLWYCMLKSGVHATVAGVMLAMTIPLAPKEKSRGQLITDILEKKASPLDSPAVFLEKSLLKWVALIILPIFAFSNAGVALSSVQFGTLSLGVILGLSLGKPLGVTSFAFIAERFGWVSLPEGLNWWHLMGLGCLAGIGFTMSLFIGSLAFTDQALLDEAKLSIILASLISASMGIFILFSAGKK